jgi:hypothetical protein
VTCWWRTSRWHPTRAVRGYAAERLPAYAVPAAVLLLPRLPLTPQGKYDHDQLAARPLPGADDAAGADRAAVGGAGQGPLGLVLAAWRRVLPAGEIRAGDAFVELGGTSLAAARVAGWLGERTETPPTAADVLRAADAAALADRLVTSQGGPDGTDDRVAAGRRGAGRMPADG